MSPTPNVSDERLPNLPGPYRSASIGAAVGAGYGVAFDALLWMLCLFADGELHRLAFTITALFLGFGFAVVGSIVGVVTRSELARCPMAHLLTAARSTGAQAGLAVSWATHAALTIVVFLGAAVVTGGVLPGEVMFLQLFLLPVLTTPFFLCAGITIGHLIALRAR